MGRGQHKDILVQVEIKERKDNQISHCLYLGGTKCQEGLCKSTSVEELGGGNHVGYKDSELGRGGIMWDIKIVN